MAAGSQEEKGIWALLVIPAIMIDRIIKFERDRGDISVIVQ